MNTASCCGGSHSQIYSLKAMGDFEDLKQIKQCNPHLNEATAWLKIDQTAF